MAATRAGGLYVLVTTLLWLGIAATAPAVMACVLRAGPGTELTLDCVAIVPFHKKSIYHHFLSKNQKKKILAGPWVL